ncbi:Ubiquitin carboxyl-terminal hydrolase 8 [Sarcoptes scabiei]|uniref:Ubiquitin carboxyl-terminal hydrolase n=1 Tax=Sarcoptes scabiei TaxID=52283 RepID=A0A834VEN9_SARSC|nr:Ubiquitin carboxyl-terminal hydrolase 8 [Sarcoptes scabiei]
MPSITKKELYVAQSLEELRKKSEIKKFGSKEINRIIDLTRKLHQNAHDSLRKGDDEYAYIFFYRLAEITSYVPNDTRKLFMDSVGTIANESYKQMDQLTTELKERYSERKKEKEQRKAIVFKEHPIPGTSVKVDNENFESNIDDDSNENDENYKTITAKQLVSKIQSLSEINKVLVIDIRQSEEFNNSSISANKFSTNGEINVINIPEEYIKPGLTFSQLQSKISLGFTWDSLDRRRSMDYVVIVDENSTNFNSSSLSYTLANALWKWDFSAKKIKNRPFLLHGGFDDFVLTYPTLTTNPKSIDDFCRNVNTFSNKNRNPNFDLIYENFFEEKSVNSKQKIQNLSDSSISFPSSNSIHLSNNLDSNTLRDSMNKQTKFPGTARPIIPDRSSKPILDLTIDPKKSIQNDSLINNNVDKFPPKPAHLVESLKNSNRNVVKFPARESTDKLNENGDMKISYNNRQPKIDNDEVFPMDEEMSELDHTNDNHDERIDNIVEDSDDENLMNDGENNYSQKISHNATSNLSRSLSSPNIAQFEQKFSYPNEMETNSILMNRVNNSPRFSMQLPHVDRSVKPISFLNNLRKVRDFSPQFSSCARITGLRNLGNTCFMNAILQSLRNTYDFYEFLISGDFLINANSKFGSNGELTYELIELFKQMHYPSNYKNISPRDFKNAVSRHIPDFTDYKQQDAHEFLVRLLDRIHSDLNRRSTVNTINPTLNDPNFYDKLSIEDATSKFWTWHIKQNSSIVTTMFEGLIVSTVTCLHCKSVSKSLEAFTCLTLPIPENQSRTTLKNCINLFLRRERISNEAEWQCQECKQKRDAEKCTIIWRLPQILIIHLKRFTYDGMWRQKISTFVDFPLDNLIIEAQNGQKNQSYSLYSVVNHFGSLEGGHYVAYSRNKDENIDWNRYDDQDVSSMSPSDVVTQNAYVLFYKTF